MLRTQIYLPEYEYKKLKEKARAQEKTFAEVVRELLRRGMEKESAEEGKQRKKKKLSGGEFLLSLAKEAERLKLGGAKNASTTVDEVVYGFKKQK